METHFENIERAHGSMARQRVLTDLRALIHDSEVLVKATAGDVSEAARDARGRVVAALTRAQATYSALQEQTMARANAAAREADTLVRAHPYQTLSVAFVVGLLAGLLITRK